MILLVDNQDSFTYNLADLFGQFYKGVEVRRQEDMERFPPDMDKVKGIVFSPGPMTPFEHPIMFELLKKFHKTLPILGICLGCQAIGAFYGWGIEKMEKPLHGKTTNVQHYYHQSFWGVPEKFEVMHYHSLFVQEKKETNQLAITAQDQQGLPMALAHTKDLVWGVQFHPESILTEHGYKLVKNWLNLLSKN